MTEKSKRLFTGLAGSPLAKTEDLVFSTPISPPSPDELKRLEDESRKQLGITSIKYLRKLFDPPLCVENVAMFLVIPEVLYFIDEENPPLIRWEKVHTLAIPFLQVNRKHPFIDGFRAPLSLREKLASVIEELQTTLTARQSKAAGGPTGAALTKARRTKRAERKRIEKEINRYETEWIKEDVPTTGRESFTVLVPRCEGVGASLTRIHRGYTLSEVKKYIRAAWGAILGYRKEEVRGRGEWTNDLLDGRSMTIWEKENKAVLGSWEFVWGEFENAVIRRAVAAGIFSPLPQFREHFVSPFDTPQISNSDALDHSLSAAGLAQSGYTGHARRHEAAPRDIRRTSRGQKPDWEE